MELKTLKIKALKAWREGNKENKKLLENLYGTEIFQNQDVCDRVQSYEDACIEIGESPLNEMALLSAGFTQKEIIGRKLDAITKALNGGVPINIYNGQRRWYPYFNTVGSPASFSFCASACCFSFAYLGGGSRLCFHEKKTSDYAGQQFIDLIREYIH